MISKIAKLLAALVLVAVAAGCASMSGGDMNAAVTPENYAQ